VVARWGGLRVAFFIAATIQIFLCPLTDTRQAQIVTELQTRTNWRPSAATRRPPRSTRRPCAPCRPARTWPTRRTGETPGRGRTEALKACPAGILASLAGNSSPARRGDRARVHVLPHHLRTEEKVMDSTDIHPVISQSRTSTATCGPNQRKMTP
jgi:hypothetical protein